MWSRYCTQWTVLGLEKKKKKPEQTWRAPQPNWISEQNAGKDSILLWCQNQTFYPRGCRDLEDGGTTWKKKGFASTCLVGSSRLKTQKKKKKPLWALRACGPICVCIDSFQHAWGANMCIRVPQNCFHLVFVLHNPSLWQILSTPHIAVCLSGAVTVQSSSPANTFLLSRRWQCVCSLCLKTPLCSARVLFV